MQWLIFLYFPLLASLSVVGACIKVLIADLQVGNNLTVEWMFCVAVATILFMIAGITKIMKEDEEDRSYIRPVSGLLIAAGATIRVRKNYN